MNQDTFKTNFQAMCLEKYSGGATLMEIFMTLNDPNMTLKQVQEWLMALYDQGFCKNHTDNLGTERYLYIEAPQIPQLSQMASSPSNEFFNNFLQTYQKSEQQMQQTFQQGFQQILIQNQQMLEQQKAILLAMQSGAVVPPPAQQQQQVQAPYNPPMSSSSSSSSSSVASKPAQMPQTIQVKSFTSNEFYTVDLTHKTCTCPNYVHVQSKNNGECKHLKAAMEHHPVIQLAMESD